MKKRIYIVTLLFTCIFLSLGIAGTVVSVISHQQKSQSIRSSADPVIDESLPMTEFADNSESTTDLETINASSSEPLWENESEETESIYEEQDAPDSNNPSIKVKGLYVTGPTAGSKRLDELIALADETEINTFVIDVKNDEGNITWKMNTPLVSEVKSGVRYIQDIEATIQKCKEHDIYLIARIVCFKDPYFANFCKEAALVTPTGSPVCDANGIAWINPYNEQGWAYLAEIAREAVRVGFDEVQFDYVRFPIGTEAEKANYGVNIQEYSKKQGILNFLSYEKNELASLGVPVSADLFGTVIGSETDIKTVGQDYTTICETIDAVCPMIYPSHYNNHVFGLDVPDRHPYDTIKAALEKSQTTLSGISPDSCATIRPWLQAFTATWVDGHITYGQDELKQQIQAVYDAGYEEWLLWNASNKYSITDLEFLKEKR